MKLAQRQQGDVQGGKWGGQARAESEQGHHEPDEHESEPVGMRAVGTHGAVLADDPYRGMSDGEMLEF
jgi:hypothetical protein